MRRSSRRLQFFVLSVVAIGLAACATLRGAPGGPASALVGATLIDGTGSAAIPNAVVVIRGARIVAVGPRATTRIPSGATIENVAGLTIIPGLIDSHVHIGMTAMGSPIGEPNLALLKEFLRHGVTTIRDPGDGHPWILTVRADIAAGRVIGPRIYAAGPTLTAPGGHPAGTLLKGNNEAIASGTRQVSNTDSARAAVRALAADGVDFIKAIYDGGSRRSPFGLLPKLDRTVLSAIVDEAKRLGLPVTVHWGNTSELPDLVAVAPNQLEHIGVSPIADSTIRHIVDGRIVVDPTLVVYEKMLPPEAFGPLSMGNAGKLVKAGVTLTAGTDAPLAGLAFGESLHHELELLVRAGLTPMQAIQSATRNAAVAMRKDRDLGTVEVGKFADLVVLTADPTQSIANVRKIQLVLRDGRVVERR